MAHTQLVTAERETPRSRGPSVRIQIANLGISHPNRVLFPAARAAKLDLARYYESIADYPWKGYEKARQTIPRGALRALDNLA